tara:strand:- start:474 stop:1205 length:732 start_codon:yes stop_codon:yes gene_type:complete
LKSVIEAARKVGIHLDLQQQARFQRYCELIEIHNKRFNLTGHKTHVKIREELIIRSLRVLSPAGGSIPTPEWFTGKHAIDIGSGAGVPGLVMKIAIPDIEITLLDSTKKRTNFLKEVISDLKLVGIQVINGRAEDLGQNSAHRESYDVVTARAVARLPELAELTIPFAKIGGTVILPKSSGVATEVQEASVAAECLGAAPAIVIEIKNPGAALPDDMVYWMKICETPSRFPRRVGVPHQSPLI